MQMKTERFEMRIDRETLENVDAWRANQPDLPSRAEAVRRLVDAGLDGSRNGEVRISDGEKLILAMLCDRYEHQKGEVLSNVVDGKRAHPSDFRLPLSFHRR